jgi:hypothetical protein
MRLRSQDNAEIEYTLKPRSSSVRFSTTTITTTPNETQSHFCLRISILAKMPLSRLRVTLEKSKTVIDKRAHADAVPKIEDLPEDETVVLVKDLGTFSLASSTWGMAS